MGFPVHRRYTPELLGLMKGRKDVDQWTREGAGVSRGEASAGPKAPSSSYGPSLGISLEVKA